jgi:hypothetical protein
VFRIWRLSVAPASLKPSQRALAGLGPPPATVGTLALSVASPSPIQRGLEITFALPNPAPARLELLDVAGRRIAAREIDGPVLGSRTMRIAEPGALRAGVYMVRLQQGNETRVTRVVVLP